MIKYSPFADINSSGIAQLRGCLFSSAKTYKKNEIIIHLEDSDETFAVVDSGTVHLMRIDVNGNKSIIDYYEGGDVFGKKLAPSSQMDTYYFIAKETCSICFINFRKLLSKCDNNCEKHTVLLNNLLMITLQKSQIHLDVLSQRSIRQKLLTFFNYLSVHADSESFALPLSLSDLADYLSVDRSAMMREIKKLKNEQIIMQKNNRITLNKNRYSL